MNFFDVDMPKVWVLLILLSFANPPFVYFISFLFKKAATGSLVMRLFYILVGGLVTLVVLGLE